MTVYFIGAGPGAPDLLTLRGRDLIARCPVCLYAGSLVPPAVIAMAPKHAQILDTASLTLPEIMDEFVKAATNGSDVARVHSGDPCVFGAITEQMRRLDKLGIAYEMIPGVSAYAAAAAALKAELTVPSVSQTVILTRTQGKASSMPPLETLEQLGRIKATLVLHLSIRQLRTIVSTLGPLYGWECPVQVIYRVSWPDQQIISGLLSDIVAKVRKARITRTALIMVGWVFDRAVFCDSALYDPDHVHVLRPRRQRTKTTRVTE